jgi:hypothetical protein
LSVGWEAGWDALFATLNGLTNADLNRSVTIREEPHTVLQAVLRGMSHVSYHVGQILYLVRMLRPDSDWLTVRPGTSRSVSGEYRKAP